MPKSTKQKVRSQADVRLRKTARNRPVTAGLILAVALLGGVTLRGVQAASKRTIISDEGISFLAATGHQGEYGDIVKNERHPHGTWVPASEWKRLIRIEDKFCLKQIGADLARGDIHPPLYFWLLHLWMMVVGTHLWTGPTLNILIASASTVALFGLGRDVFKDSLPAALVAFVWALSPTVIQASAHARQYDLMGLCTILFVWQVLKCGDVRRSVGWGTFGLLAIITSAGLLTHYHFPLLVFACAILLSVGLAMTDRRRLMSCYVSIAIGGAMFYLLHPHFLTSLLTARRQTQAFACADVANRIREVLLRYTSFFVDTFTLHGQPRRVVQYAVLALLILLTVKMVVGYLRRRKTTGSPSDEGRRNEFRILVLFAWTVGTNIFLYLACMSPRHAMQARHASMVYPLFAFLPVLILYSFRRWRAVLTPLLCVGFLVAGVHSVWHASRGGRKPNAPSVHAAKADTVIINNLRRVFLPTAIMYLPDEVMTLAASPEYLEAHQKTWENRLGDESLWMSHLSAGQDRACLDRIASRLASRYNIVQTEGHVADRGTLITLRRKPSHRNLGAPDG